MAYFDARFLEFFEGLAIDNSKDYFDRHRRVYEQAVRDPFKELVGDVAMRIGESEPGFSIEPKDAMFRINRDIRFSKDKSPYKTHMGALLSKHGRRDLQWPGFYFQLSHEGVMAGGGVYMPEKEAVQRIRVHIARDPDAFTRVIEDPVFKGTFGQVQGDRLKRVPPEFREVLEVQPYVANKAWYYMTDMPIETVLADDLVDRLMEVHSAGRGMAGFLRDALTR